MANKEKIRTIPETSDLISQFEKVGISEREAKLYSAMLEFGEMNATELQRVTGISQNKIYSVLSKMVVRGLCSERLEGRKRFFAPVRPELIKETLADQWEKEFIKKKKSAAQTFDNLEKLFIEAEPQNFLKIVEVIRNKDQVQRRYISLVNETDNEILGFNRSPFAASNRELLDAQNKAQVDALERGVVIRAIFMDEGFDYINMNVEKLHENDKTRITDYLPLKMYIYDTKKVLFAIPSNPERHVRDMTMVVIDDPGFADMCKSTFEQYWEKSEDFFEFLARLKDEEKTTNDEVC